MANTEQIVADRIREYSDTFGAAFHAKDASLLRPYCHVPSMTIGGGRAFSLSTIEESDERWTRALAGLPDDYDHSILHTVDVTMMSPETALVSVDCGRFNTKDDEYARFGASYVAILVDGTWLITTWIGLGAGAELQTVRF